MTKAEADADNSALSKLISALDATAGALKKDGCGAWHVAGTRGHIHFDGSTWTIYIQCRSPLGWTWAIEKIISKTTRATVGVDVSPHLFRTSAASTAAIYAGHIPSFGSALLHHRDSRITERHYNRATSLSATQRFAALIGSSEK